MNTERPLLLRPRVTAHSDLLAVIAGMLEASGIESMCDWPACPKVSAHELSIESGMVLRIEGVAFDGPAFAVCEEHAPRIARIALGAVDDALRRHAARANFAPGDAEWTDNFGDDRR